MRAGLCIRVLEPHIYVFVFLLCLLLLVLPYHVVCITPSLKLSSSRLWGRHGTAAVALQVCVDHYLLCVCWHSIRVCAVCTMIRVVYVGVCGSVRLCAETQHTFHFFCLLFFTAAAVSCRLYHTVPQVLKLATMWQPRQYNSSRTLNVWVDHVYAFVDIACACV